MPLLFPANDEEQRTLLTWAVNQLGIRDYGPCRAIGVHHGDQIVAVAIFHEFRYPNIEVTFVTSSPRWASPKAVKAILRYPFKQLGCSRVTATTKAKNQPARAFLCRLGFRQEGYHPDVFLDDDAVSYGLLRKDAARWLGEEFEQEYTSSSGSARSSSDGERANCI